VTITVLAGEYFCMKLETAEIKLSVNDLLEKGKEIGMKSAQKLMNKKESKRKGSREMTKIKKKDKTEEV
jgi:hypothetical protein